MLVITSLLWQLELTWETRTMKGLSSISRYIYIQTYIHTYIYICLDIVLLILVMDDEQGIAIGNGLTYPETQYPMYRDYALQMKLINQADYFSLNSSVAQCVQAAHLCGKIKKESFLQKFLKKILIFALNSNEIFSRYQWCGYL